MRVSAAKHERDKITAITIRENADGEYVENVIPNGQEASPLRRYAEPVRLHNPERGVRISASKTCK